MYMPIALTRHQVICVSSKYFVFDIQKNVLKQYYNKQEYNRYK